MLNSKQNTRIFKGFSLIKTAIFSFVLFISAFWFTPLVDVQLNSSQFESIGEKVTHYFELDESDSEEDFSVIKLKVSKYRKKLKQVSYSVICLQPYTKGILKRYLVPSSVARYERPHFYSAQHSFLYRLTYF